MKKIILTFAATLAGVAAFAQGKVSFVNDSLHLAYFCPDPSGLYAADAALAGQGVTNITSSGVMLVVDLYQGTSSASLAFLSSTTIGSSLAGRFGPASIVVGVAAPGTQFYQVQVRDSSVPSATDAVFSGKYYGFSPIFTCSSGSITPISIVSPSSTWAVGTFNMDQYGAGSRGAIAVGLDCIPEPNTFALAGLGAAVVLAFGRRK
jgi:hypothetical protein